MVLCSSQGSSDDTKKVMRREKNRIAAQKSRMRQTQKADTLHLVRHTASRDLAGDPTWYRTEWVSNPLHTKLECPALFLKFTRSKIATTAITNTTTEIV